MNWLYYLFLDNIYITHNFVFSYDSYIGILSFINFTIMFVAQIWQPLAYSVNSHYVYIVF